MPVGVLINIVVVKNSSLRRKDKRVTIIILKRNVICNSDGMFRYQKYMLDVEKVNVTKSRVYKIKKKRERSVSDEHEDQMKVNCATRVNWLK